MELEDQILSEIEKRDTIIMRKEQEIVQNKQALEQKEQVIEQKDRMLQDMVLLLTEAGVSIEEIAQRLFLSPQEVEDLI